MEFSWKFTNTLQADQRDLTYRDLMVEPQLLTEAVQWATCHWPGACIAVFLADLGSAQELAGSPRYSSEQLAALRQRLAATYPNGILPLEELQSETHWRVWGLAQALPEMAPLELQIRLRGTFWLALAVPEP